MHTFSLPCFLHITDVFFFEILFIQETEREREREKREKQAPCREPDVVLDSGSPGSHPGLNAALNC